MEVTSLPKTATTLAAPHSTTCKSCGAYLVLEPDEGYSDEEKERILRAYKERSSMRAIEHIFGVSRNTLSKRLKKGHQQPDVSATVEEAEQGDILEMFPDLLPLGVRQIGAIVFAHGFGIAFGGKAIHHRKRGGLPFVYVSEA